MCVCTSNNLIFGIKMERKGEGGSVVHVHLVPKNILRDLKRNGFFRPTNYIVYVNMVLLLWIIILHSAIKYKYECGERVRMAWSKRKRRHEILVFHSIIPYIHVIILSKYLLCTRLTKISPHVLKNWSSWRNERKHGGGERNFPIFAFINFSNLSCPRQKSSLIVSPREMDYPRADLI